MPENKLTAAVLALILFLLGGSAQAQPLSDAFPPLTSLKVPDYVKVVDFTGRGAVPLGSALIPDQNKPIVIVVADELTLNNEEFDYCKGTAPRQVILIADTIRITGYTRFYLAKRILGMDPQPPCSSPYLTGPNLGQTLPPVLSLVARNLFISKEAAVCMFCKFEGGRFDIGGVTDPSVDTAAKPSLTIAAEKVEFRAKAELFFEKALPSVPPPNSEATPTWALGMAALVPFGLTNSSGVEQTSWGKVFFDHINARGEEAPLTESDLSVIRNFWKAALQSAPEKLHLGFFLTGRHGTRIVDGVEQFSWDIDDLAFGNDAYFPNKLSDAGRNDPHAVRGVSLWTVHTFQKIYLDMLEADRLEQRSEVLRLLRTFNSLPSYPVRPEHNSAYFQAVDAVKSIRERYRNQLWRRAVQLDAVNASPMSVELFSEGAALETYVAPMQALVIERMLEGRTVLGTLRYVGSGETPDIELKFSAALGVDPLVADAIKAKLSQGELYSGQFSNWDLVPRQIQYQGIKSSSARVLNNTLEVTLRLDGKTGTQALWQLTSETGVPLTLDYEYRNDPTQKGKLVAIPLSLARRQRSPIEVTAAGLRTHSAVSVTVTYVKLADGNLHLLQPRLVVAPGEVIAVPGVSGDQLNGLTVPAEAVSVNTSGSDSLNDFENAQHVKLTEQIKIKNTVPVTRITRPGNLQRLDLRVVYKTDDGEEQETTVSLAPAGITGSETKLTFVRLSQHGVREIWISGTAVYDNGADTIVPQKFPAGDVLIDAEILSANTPN